MKLTRLGKVLFTLLVLIISIVVYCNTGKFGMLAQDSLFYQYLTLLSWAWLTIGQCLILAKIWE